MTAFEILREVTQDTDKPLLAASVQKALQKKNPPAKSPISKYLAKIGRKGGLKGGKAGAKTLSLAKRKEIAQKGARKRWGKDL